VKGEEEDGGEEENGLDGLEDAGRDGVRVVHLLRRLNAGWWREFQTITEVLRRDGKRCGRAEVESRREAAGRCRAGCYSFLSIQWK
jgi:hypothetical protein